MDRAFLAKLRLLGYVEGVSTLLLFGVAMPLKYLAGLPLAVTIAGSVHGLLFLALVGAAWVAVDRVPLGLKLGAAVVVGAVIPFGPFVVDRWLGRLADAPAASDGARAQAAEPEAGAGRP